MWNDIVQIHLTINMCVVTDEVDFAKYLLTLGNGTAPVHPEVGDDMIQILKEYLVNSLDELIEKVFQELSMVMQTSCLCHIMLY